MCIPCYKTHPLAPERCACCRYLMCVNDDQVKLLLETVQMSVSSCMQHPELPTLRPQMVGRLMAAHHSSRVAVGPSRSKLAEFTVREIVCCPDCLDHDVAQNCTAFACVWSADFCKLTRLKVKFSKSLRCFIVAYFNVGNWAHSCWKRMSCFVLHCLARIGNLPTLCAWTTNNMYLSLSLLPEIHMTSYTIQAWLAQQQQQMRASSNITKALMPKTASLEQAGGLHRMVLRGHSGPIQKVLLAPGGTDVITGIPFSSKLT